MNNHILKEDTPLPSQKATLTVSGNKSQLICHLFKYIKHHNQRVPDGKRLVIIADDPIPVEVTIHAAIRRRDMKITHEEADTVIINQVVHLAYHGKHSAIADQLLPVHVLSGCDSVSQLYGIGKGTVLKNLYHHSLN